MKDLCLIQADIIEEHPWHMIVFIWIYFVGSSGSLQLKPVAQSTCDAYAAKCVHLTANIFLTFLFKILAA